MCVCGGGQASLLTCNLEIITHYLAQLLWASERLFM